MTEANKLVTQIEKLGEKLDEVRAMISQVFIGQDRVVEQILITLLSGGHAILVGLPGLGKTKLVEALSIVMGVHGNRVQFTPDLMPADILGSEVLEAAEDGSKSFRFIKGPVFCQLLMADEINRASPRTQSALLQAMQEGTVTVSGQNRHLGSPFHVLATQNPIEQEGTYPLPEAQLDRFLLEIQVQYPDRAAERDILLATTGTKKISLKPVFDASQILAAQTLIRQMPVGDSVVELILDLVRAFRPEDPSAPDLVRENMRWGPGPRASQALMLAVRAQALLRGDLAPSAVDVASLAPAVLNHRMSMGFAAQSRGMTQLELISEVTNTILQKKAGA